MATIAFWLLAAACTGKIDDSEPGGGDDSNTPPDDSAGDDSGTDDSGGKTTGDRWDGKYVGDWSLSFNKVPEHKKPGACHGNVVLTVANNDVVVEPSLSGCEGVAVDAYGKLPAISITKGVIVLNPDSPTNSGTAWFTVEGPKDSCGFEFDWTFADSHDPTNVFSDYFLRSEEQFKHLFCLGGGYKLDFLAEIPKKDD
jgi:hypothetical protein